MIEFELSGEREVRTVLELRRRFFKWHIEKIQKRDWPNPVPTALDPISLILNPPQLVDEKDFFSINTWFAVYYRRYYVTVQQNLASPLSGPHIAKLHLQLYERSLGRAGCIEWLGTTQLNCAFFSEDRVRIALRKAIRLRQYFISEAAEEIEIDIQPPQDPIEID